MRRRELVPEPGRGCSSRRHEMPIASVMSPDAIQTMPGNWSHWHTQLSGGTPLGPKATGENPGA